MMLRGKEKVTTATETICGTLHQLQKAGGLKKDNPTGDAEKELRPSIEAPGDREVYLKESPAPHPHPNTHLVLGQTLSF